uniref:Uncharacterized protein n=1 Tax=Octopus bimaculoides TaxID=37653 RepID=A0A0L8I5G8_OCTBM
MPTLMAEFRGLRNKHRSPSYAEYSRCSHTFWQSVLCPVLDLIASLTFSSLANPFTVHPSPEHVSTFDLRTDKVVKTLQFSSFDYRHQLSLHSPTSFKSESFVLRTTQLIFNARLEHIATNTSIPWCQQPTGYMFYNHTTLLTRLGFRSFT